MIFIYCILGNRRFLNESREHSAPLFKALLQGVSGALFFVEYSRRIYKLKYAIIL